MPIRREMVWERRSVLLTKFSLPWYTSKCEIVILLPKKKKKTKKVYLKSHVYEGCIDLVGLVLKRVSF